MKITFKTSSDMYRAINRLRAIGVNISAKQALEDVLLGFIEDCAKRHGVKSLPAEGLPVFNGDFREYYVQCDQFIASIKNNGRFDQNVALQLRQN